MKILYVKYADLRNPQFCIRTSIFEDENARRRTRKDAVSDIAKGHLENIFKGAEMLRKAEPSFSVVDISWSSDGAALIFPYYDGLSLEEIIHNGLCTADDDGVYKLLDRYKIELLSLGSMETDPRKNADFLKLFDPKKSQAVERENFLCLPIAPLDLLPSNIIENSDGQWTNIDPEWIFDFAVPLNFILYRAVKSIEKSRSSLLGLKSEQMLYHYGILPDEALIYESWDQSFSNYVYEKEGLFAAHKRYEKPVYMLYTDPSKSDETKKLTYAPLAASRVYFDCGDGFCEEKSEMMMTRSGQPFSWRWDLEEANKQLKGIRFDPCEGELVYLRISKALWIDENGEYHEFARREHNGWPWENGLVYSSLDPNISFFNENIMAADSIVLEGAWRCIAKDEIQEMLILSKLNQWQEKHGGANVSAAFQDLLAWHKDFWQGQILEVEEKLSAAQGNLENKTLENSALNDNIKQAHFEKRKLESERLNEKKHFEAERIALLDEIAAYKSKLERFAEKYDSSLNEIEDLKKHFSEIKAEKISLEDAFLLDRESWKKQEKTFAEALQSSKNEAFALQNKLSELQDRLSWRVMEQPRKIYARLHQNKPKNGGLH